MKENILLVEPNYESKFKPLGLMRISSYHKFLGDNVVYVKGNRKDIHFRATPAFPNKIYITTLFTYEYKEVLKTIRFYKKNYPKAKIMVGGILASLLPKLLEKEQVELHKGLWQEIEKFPPDYTLFPPEEMNYSLTFTSRGCINKCAFCVVPKLEGKFYSREWLQDIDLQRKNIIFMDNNWLAKDEKDLEKDIINLRGLVKKGVANIDFNQSLDCRLITEKHYKLLRGLPINPLRFSFDNMSQDGYIQKAIELAYKYGFTHIHVDVLYNFTDTIEEFYYRIKELIRLIGKQGGGVILMKYAPIDRVDKDYVGKHWTKKEAEGVHRINPYPYGIISSKSMQEFEYFFGKDAEEFKKLLNFTDIRMLTKLKMKKFSSLKVENKTNINNLIQNS